MNPIAGPHPVGGSQGCSLCKPCKSDVQETAAQMLNQDTPLKAAHNVMTHLVEWPRTPWGIASHAWFITSTIQLENCCLERAQPLLGPPWHTNSWSDLRILAVQLTQLLKAPDLGRRKALGHKVTPESHTGCGIIQSWKHHLWWSRWMK